MHDNEYTPRLPRSSAAVAAAVPLQPVLILEEGVRAARCAR